jgi:hypothetical protein
MNATIRRVLRACFLILSLSTGVAAVAQPPVDRLSSCGPARDRETLAFAQRVIADDHLYRFLESASGRPTRCRTEALREKDYESVTLQLTWTGGMELNVSFSSPEISITTLRDAMGLERVAGLEAFFRTYVRNKGLAIDWTAPTETRQGETVEREYSDPEQGLNGIARLKFDAKGRLIEMSQSTAP